ncbi:MAG: UDP-glucose 4-epimerase GalE [Candidatus Gastranaerophilales bacterium]|nr:UDP-glucose 4-epimerase GalE [Candidatus Gastranaerophilales bacterium]
MPNRILVTGGGGYIGSHCVLELLQRGKDVIVFDNLSTGHKETVDELSNYGNLDFIRGDLKNQTEIDSVFERYNITSVLHFAALSQVGESIKYPEKYYENNVKGTENLLSSMVKHGVKRIIFSSTASVYGEPEELPINEEHKKNPVNPYGNTKLAIEEMLDDYDKKYGIKSVRLRYFNVIGADEQGRTGEWHEPETHLIPNLLKSAAESGREFELYGNDYPTKDGTCTRDYICVQDIVNAHLLALDYLLEKNVTNYFNLGTNSGFSVKEVLDLCSEVTGKQIKVKLLPKRAGDAVCLVADNKKAQEVLGWKPLHSLRFGIETAYRWNEILYKKIKI